MTGELRHRLPRHDGAVAASMRPRSNDRGISMVHKSFIFNDLEPPFRVPAAQGRDSCRSPVATHL